jgi:hypothetical protein
MLLYETWLSMFLFVGCYFQARNKNPYNEEQLPIPSPLLRGYSALSFEIHVEHLKISTEEFDFSTLVITTTNPFIYSLE